MSENSPSFSVVRMANGQFAPGSGGRPRGTRNKVSNAALQSVKAMSDEAIQQLKAKLASGDWQAICFVLERILPRGRIIELDGVSPQDVLSQMIEGEISCVEAKDIATALRNLTEISELKEIAERLKLLEAILAGER